jgi:hypothetical protein
MKRSIKYTIAGACAVLALAVAGCTGQNSLNGGGGFKDVKGVSPQNADSYTLYNNVDKYPNVVVMCVKGVALVTTTRDAQSALQHIVELDRTCPGYVAPAAR